MLVRKLVDELVGIKYQFLCKLGVQSVALLAVRTANCPTVGAEVSPRSFTYSFLCNCDKSAPRVQSSPHTYTCPRERAHMLVCCLPSDVLVMLLHECVGVVFVF